MCYAGDGDQKNHRLDNYPLPCKLRIEMPRGIFPRTPEYRAKLSAAMIGHPVSADQRIKVSLSLMRPGLAPVEEATSNDIRWAAGFFEGEGAVNYRNRNAQISQKDPWTLEHLRALFGGSIYKEKRRESSYVWNICGPRARGFLQTIYGLLSPRRQEQIRKVLQVGEFSTVGLSQRSMTMPNRL